MMLPTVSGFLGCDEARRNALSLSFVWLAPEPLSLWYRYSGSRRNRRSFVACRPVKQSPLPHSLYPYRSIASTRFHGFRSVRRKSATCCRSPSRAGATRLRRHAASRRMTCAMLPLETTGRPFRRGHILDRPLCSSFVRRRRQVKRPANQPAHGSMSFKHR